jgi:hypothetical protein
MTLSRGCRSDKAKFAHNRRLDFAVREALLIANPASHVNLKGSRASNNTITTVPFSQGCYNRFTLYPCAKRGTGVPFYPGIFNLIYENRKKSIQKIIPQMDVILKVSIND